tara:strand:- start:431 stop:742 length:312 start_codon:yes stop_codon:yes gene_type:complete
MSNRRGKTLQRLTVEEVQNASMGQGGAKFISDNAVHTGSFVAIQCLEDTVFQSLIPLDITLGYGTDTYSANTMAGEVISAGITFYGRWTTIDLASGLVIAYTG